MPCFRGRKGDDDCGIPATGPEVLRPLGALEKLESAMHSLGIYYGCALTCRYAIPAALRGGRAHAAAADADDDGALRAHFERAVALAVLDHPLLQVGLAGESTKAPIWVRLDRIDLRHHIQWQTVGVGVEEPSCSSTSTIRSCLTMDTALEDTIKTQHDAPFPDLETRPGWKMVVLRSPGLDYVEAFFGLNHANADGVSAKIFQQTLLEKLNLLSSSTASSTPSAPDLSSSRSPTAPRLAAVPPAAASTWAPQRPVPVRTAQRLAHLDAAALRRVLDACRGHDTTLTGLVQAMSVTSLAMRTRTATATAPGGKHTKKQQKKSSLPPPLVMGTPISMHRYIRPDALAGLKVQDPARTMVNSVTYCFHKYHGPRLASLYDLAGDVVVRDDGNSNEDATTAEKGCSSSTIVGGGTYYNAERRLEDAVWAQAARVRRQIAQKLARGTCNDLTALLRFVPDCRGRLADDMAAKAERPRDVTVEVSNLGVIDGSGEVKPGTPQLQQTAVKDCSSSTCSADSDAAVAVASTHDEGEERNPIQEEDKGQTGWTIERAVFTQSGIPHGVALVVSPVAVKGKGLTIAVNWQGGLVDEGVAAGLAADLEAWLGCLGRGTT
ncbi:hypothetical protein PG994_006688 [Apiospora phragmitis]|uniref:Alcohol acetyltransferase n=1 Tax=Apiospora phragmitis TaxID=2905665 RepID=A0ABR1VGT2_9PEZI